MMPNPLLSSYRAGENRVTSSTMAVFERVDLALVQELLGAASGAGAELRGVTFENQVMGTGSVPDARISGRFSWWFETKTVRGDYRAEGHGRQQVRLHSRKLEGDPESLLFVLTPDAERPHWFGELDGVDTSVRDRILWVGFRDLAEAITTLVGDAARPIGEQARFLLSELVALYETDGLLSSDDTVIVAARVAWPEYQAMSAYVCQPERAFRPGLTHFGFYADGAIQPLIARIDGPKQTAVPFTYAEAQSRRKAGQLRVASLIDELLGNGSRIVGESYDVILLSGPADPRTVRLETPVLNDTITEAGRKWAWTLGQRYTSIDRLKSGVTLTSQL